MTTNLLFLFLLFLSLLFFHSSAQTPPSTLCKSTPFPSFCNTILPTTNSSSSVYDYGRFSVRKSLSASRKFLSLIHKHLRKSSTLSTSAIRALQDCQFLAQCNVDNLITTSQIVNTTSQTLSVTQGDDIQTLLSAILTNTQTCIDGIQATASAWSVRNGILSPLSNDTRLFSVSLALFKKGWVPNKKRKSSNQKPGNKHLSLQMSQQNQAVYRTMNNNNNNNNRKLLQSDDISNQVNRKQGSGHLSLTMSGKNQAVYRIMNNNRKLLQADVSNEVVVSDMVVVSQDGEGNFTSINDAVSAAPNKTDGSNGYFMIYITAGVYEEYVIIPKYKKYVMMLGDGINQTIVTGNHSVVDGWTTFNSGTLAVMGTGFFAVGITFRNTAGPIKHQAVAVRNSADLSTFYSCSFEAYQDTLYVHSLRQFYYECDIYGTVDFIFGNAAVVFQNCNLYPRLPMANQFNAITAQGRTDPNQNTGISIHNCTIQAADDLANSNVTIRTYLGRPWKEYSRTVYMQSFMDSSIHPSGWSVWSGDFALNTSYYAEFNNTGPGSDTSQRVTWPGFRVINATDAANFTVSAFLLGDNWIPQTGIDYTAGLIL